MLLVTLIRGFFEPIRKVDRLVWCLWGLMGPQNLSDSIFGGLKRCPREFMEYWQLGADGRDHSAHMAAREEMNNG